VERLSQTERACAIAGATLAREFTDELIIIMSGMSEAMHTLEPGHPARRTLGEAENSAQRCAGKCATLLALGERHGVRPSRASLETLAAA
jgi:hypothetical protein